MLRLNLNVSAAADVSGDDELFCDVMLSCAVVGHPVHANIGIYWF